MWALLSALRRKISAMGFLLALALLALLPAPAAALQVRVVPAAPRQGDVVMVFVAGTRGAHQVEGIPWRVGLVDAGGAPRKTTGTVTVKAGGFPVQRLTLPGGMVNLDPEAERRAANEAARMRALYDTVTPDRLWRGPFTQPVASRKPGGGFGSRRIINDQPRMPHSGIDYSADRGTPVVASNRGRVALLGEFFFAGRFVALDHGLGLYTLYFHLDGVAVTEGQMVERGQTVGTVGTSGRSTGPHLHFGAQLGRARLNPPDLYALPVRD
jgi:murein DD-endopeptidase MepM/ murein hydrolase activator NlpD